MHASQFWPNDERGGLNDAILTNWPFRGVWQADDALLGTPVVIGARRVGRQAEGLLAASQLENLSSESGLLM